MRPAAPDSMMGERCSTRVWRRVFGSEQCSREGVVERDWKYYCRHHDLLAIEAREANRQSPAIKAAEEAKYNAIWNEAIEAFFNEHLR